MASATTGGRRPAGTQPGRTSSWLLAVLCLVLGGSCTEQPGQEEAEPKELDCAVSIGIERDVPDGFDVYHGLIALQADAVLQRGRLGTVDEGLADMRFSKSPLLVKHDSDTTVKVSVGDESAGNALISWSTGATNSISVGPCDGLGSDWLVFAGGVWATEPGCVSLDIESDDVIEQIDLSVGKQC